MSFDPGLLLRKATARAKSDVANKMVSMLLHELSRFICLETKFFIKSPPYIELTIDFFGTLCPYCRRELIKGQCVVEHLEGMNRYRAGLHTPGNVLVSCSECNREKRRDDQRKDLRLAPTGWGSFLRHDGILCSSMACKSCAYWAGLFPSFVDRADHLANARRRIQSFHETEEIRQVMLFSEPLRCSAKSLLEDFYTNAQNDARERVFNALRALQANEGSGQCKELDK